MLLRPHPDSSGVPVDLLNVLVLPDRKSVATFQSPTTDNRPPTFAGHTSSEAMDPRSATDLRLIGSFWHG